jgi:hypothetical protein
MKIITIRWKKIIFCIIYEVKNNALYPDHIRLQTIACDYNVCRVFKKFRIRIHYQIFSKQAWVLWILDQWYSYFTLGRKWTSICNFHIRLSVWTKFGTGGLHVMSLRKYEDYENRFRERHVLFKGVNYILPTLYIFRSASWASWGQLRSYLIKKVAAPGLENRD